MGDRLQDVLRAMQLARAKARQEGSAAVTQQVQRDFLQPQAHNQPQAQPQQPQAPSLTQEQVLQGAMQRAPSPASGGAAASELPFDTQTMQRMGIQTAWQGAGGTDAGGSPGAPASAQLQQRQPDEQDPQLSSLRPHQQAADGNATPTRWQHEQQQQHHHHHQQQPPLYPLQLQQMQQTGAALQLRPLATPGRAHQLVLDLSQRSGGGAGGGSEGGNGSPARDWGSALPALRLHDAAAAPRIAGTSGVEAGGQVLQQPPQHSQQQAGHEGWLSQQGQAGRSAGGGGSCGGSSWRQDGAQEPQFEPADALAAAGGQERHQQQPLEMQLRLEQQRLHRQLQLRQQQQGGVPDGDLFTSSTGPEAASDRMQLHDQALLLRSPQAWRREHLQLGADAAPAEFRPLHDQRERQLQPTLPVLQNQSQQQVAQQQHQQQRPPYQEQQQLLYQQQQQHQQQRLAEQLRLQVQHAQAARSQAQACVASRERRSDSSQGDVVDLTTDEDPEEGGQAQRFLKRRLPESFLPNGGAPKRTAAGQWEAFPSAAGQSEQQRQQQQQQQQQLESDICSRQRASVLAPAPHATGPCANAPLSAGGAPKRTAAGQWEAFPSAAGQSEQQRQQQQQQQQQLESDIRKVAARELDLQQHMQHLVASLRSGTLPVSRESAEMRPLMPEERQKLEAAAVKLQDKIKELKQERVQLLMRQQQLQQQQQQARVAASSSRGQELQGPMPLSPAVQERLRGGGSNGVARAMAGVPTAVVVTTGMGGSGAAAAAGPGPSSAAVVTMTAGAGPGAVRTMQAMQANTKEGGQGQRVTEHQQALRAVIESLQVTGSEELEPPPKTLQVTVLRHQRIALAWMIRRETGPEPRGGILADDQGLGKTVTTISLIVTHTNPEECAAGTSVGAQRGAAHQQPQPGAGNSRAGGGSGAAGEQVEVEALLDDDDDEEDDLGAEEESEEDTDRFGVRLGALRAEREAAGAADAAEAGAAAADMLCGGAAGSTPPMEPAAAGGRADGSGGPPPVLAQQPSPSAQPRPQAGGVGGGAGEGAAGSPEAAKTDLQDRAKKEPPATGAAAAAGRAAGSSPPCYVDLAAEDSPPPHQTSVHSEGGSGAVAAAAGLAARASWQAEGLDADILSISEPRPAAAATAAGPAAASPLPSLPPAAASSLSQLASANLAAAVSPTTARLLESQRQRQLVAAAGATGAHHAHAKPLYEPEPPNLLLGGTLVVCPTSVLHQWAREIRDKVSPAAGLVVHVYHGKDRVSTARQLAAMSVVLTTYGTLAQEAPSRDKQAVRLVRQGTSAAPINLAAEDSGGDEPGSSAGAGPWGTKGKGGGRARSTKPGSAEGGALYQIKWRRVVLDEAQSIKNPRTLAAHAAWRLYAHCRWCLSGTPIQNTVDDLYSYFRFLRYAPYCESRKFKELIKGKIAEKPEIGYKFLQAVLQAVLLRRTKQSTINGEPIIKLPAREQQLLREKFSAAEAAFYSQVQAESLRALREAGEGGASGSRQYVNMLHSLLKLRQACNHPWLVRGARNAWHKTGNPSASEVEAARRLAPETRAALVGALSKGDAQCPCCGDIAEDPVVSACCHVFCAQCLAAQREGASVEGELLCPACSRLLRGGDLHSAAALAAVDPAAVSVFGSRPAGGGAGKGDDGGGGEWVSSAKVERLLALLEGLRSKNTAAAQQAAASTRSANPLAVKSKSDRRLAGALRKLPPLPSMAGSGGGGPSAGGGGGVPGVKPDKVIVFSQWTSMLDLLEIPLKRAKIQFRRLDGTMSVGNREKAIHDFESRQDVMVLLVSLKAAALGVNLTVANHVVLMDLWWNPTTEEQAIDRAHRIGQTRTVNVTRITIAGSVEDRILQLQQAKREVVAAALSEGRDGSSAAGRLTLEDLRFLFQGLAQ